MSDAVARLEQWFGTRGWSPFAFQREVWSAYASGESGLIHAATGTGKTYAAWMGPVLEALAEHEVPRTLRRRADGAPLRVLWITPLKALAADTVENLPGVTRVKNEIKIKSSYPEKSDAWMAFLKILKLSLYFKENIFIFYF